MKLTVYCKLKYYANRLKLLDCYYHNFSEDSYDIEADIINFHHDVLVIFKS